MSRQKKRPLPPRTLRMKRKGRLRSARTWLAAQHGRPPERIGRSYRKHYSVDWACAIVELSALGVVFDPKWREQPFRSLEAERLAKARRKAQRAVEAKCVEFPNSDATFAYIAGYTEGGTPYGTTWEELSRAENDASMGPESDDCPLPDAPPPPKDDLLPF